MEDPRSITERSLGFLPKAGEAMCMSRSFVARFHSCRLILVQTLPLRTVSMIFTSLSTSLAFLRIPSDQDVDVLEPRPLATPEGLMYQVISRKDEINLVASRLNGTMDGVFAPAS